MALALDPSPCRVDLLVGVSDIIPTVVSVTLELALILGDMTSKFGNSSVLLARLRNAVSDFSIYFELTKLL